jgi:hypothetical protein
MGIEAELKQISTHTLKLLKKETYLLGSFFDAKWLPKSPFWCNTPWSRESAETMKQQARERFGRLSWRQTVQRGIRRIFKPHEVVNYDWAALEKQFLQEWEVSELDLHKYFQQLTFLLAGYVPTHYSSGWLLPEFAAAYTNQLNQDFLPFLVIENSEWDSYPLVNAIGAGAELGYETSYGPVRYLLTNEVEQILDGLRQLTAAGFQERYQQESQKISPLPWIDWSEEEMLAWLTDYYNQMVNYYQDAATNQRAMLLYLT